MQPTAALRLYPTPVEHETSPMDVYLQFCHLTMFKFKNYEKSAISATFNPGHVHCLIMGGNQRHQGMGAVYLHIPAPYVLEVRSVLSTP